MLGFTTDGGEKGARRSFITGRNAVVIMLIVTAVLMLALPAREFLRQRGEIRTAERVAREQEEKVAKLQTQLDNWNNPDYVREQARRRLHFVLPGEVGFVVLGANDKPADVDNSRKTDQNESPPWYAQLWNSVQAADHDNEPTNHPAPPINSTH